MFYHRPPALRCHRTHGGVSFSCERSGHVRNSRVCKDVWESSSPKSRPILVERSRHVRSTCLNNDDSPISPSSASVAQFGAALVLTKAMHIVSMPNDPAQASVPVLLIALADIWLVLDFLEMDLICFVSYNYFLHPSIEKLQFPGRMTWCFWDMGQRSPGGRRRFRSAWLLGCVLDRKVANTLTALRTLRL